jgi:REP element-mobilizing transposase RayT
MDRAERKTRVEMLGPATYGRGRAVRLDPRVYSSDVPIHLIICAEDGAPFQDASLAGMVCTAIEHSAAALGFRLFVYCLMPEHLHVLVSPADARVPVSEFLRKFKGFTTNQFQKVSGNSRLWQYSARDRVKRATEDIVTLTAYIANNPVRRGLVKCWTDWPYTKVLVEI